MIDRIPDDLRFRSLAAPGLDEDELFIAMWGLPPRGLWGEGRPPPRPAEDEPWDEAAERRRRHDALMRKWGAARPAGDAPPPSAG